jgi:flagellar hook assembly protein FlgD
VRIVDASGRLVRRAWCADPARGMRWDGRDASGRRVAPGLYLVSVEGTRAPITKVVRLE